MILAEDILNKLVEKKDLTAAEARAFLDQVITGDITEAQIGAILTALRMKGETPDEIIGLLDAMRAHMLPVSAEGAIDIVGTGGDHAGTFNISTTAAFVVAGAGVKVAKHGNRAASSKCGSADVLEALGVEIELKPPQAEEVFKSVGMVFLFAPLFHPSMKRVSAVRKELKIRTIFNILGPFANPAGTKRQIVGVANRDIAQKMAEVGKHLHFVHLLVVTGFNDAKAIDEIGISGRTHVFEVKGKSVKKYSINPGTYGFKKTPRQQISGGSPEESAEIIKDILRGIEKGARRNVVVLNSAVALYVAGVVKDIKQGIKLAEESIDSGKALQVLENLKRETHRVAPKSQ